VCYKMVIVQYFFNWKISRCSSGLQVFYELDSGDIPNSVSFRVHHGDICEHSSKPSHGVSQNFDDLISVCSTFVCCAVN
jgi:hypothetical protein